MLRKLNRGLDEEDQYLKAAGFEDISRESIIGEDVVKSGKIAKPIKGKGAMTHLGGKNTRSMTEYQQSEQGRKSLFGGEKNKIHPR